MKQRIGLLALSTFIFLSSRAQHSAIVRAGVNLANVTISENGRIEDAKTLTSFQAGVIGDISITKGLAFQPGLIVTGKGVKSESGNPADANYFIAKTNPVYLEMPLNIVFKFSSNDGSAFFAGAGPYLAMGVAGKSKLEGKFFGIAFSSEDNIEWSNDDPTTTNYDEGAGFNIMKRFDYGLNATAGIEINKIVLSANYGFGLAKLQSGGDDASNDYNKHRVLSFTVGFKL